MARFADDTAAAFSGVEDPASAAERTGVHPVAQDERPMSSEKFGRSCHASSTKCPYVPLSVADTTMTRTNPRAACRNREPDPRDHDLPCARTRLGGRDGCRHGLVNGAAGRACRTGGGDPRVDDDLATDGLAAGDNAMVFTAAGDPVPHRAPFVLKA